MPISLHPWDCCEASLCPTTHMKCGIKRNDFAYVYSTDRGIPKFRDRRNWWCFLRRCSHFVATWFDGSEKCNHRSEAQRRQR
jgi:hypothetical protein